MSEADLNRHLWHILDARAWSGSDVARDRLRLAIDAAVRAEREACATIVDEWVKHFTAARVVHGNLARNFFGGGLEASEKIAAAIRNRSNTP